MMGGLGGKYKAAIIFLCVILFISIILVFIYFALKRGMCNCFGTKNSDDEEGFYDDVERDEYDDYDNLELELGEEEDEDLPAVDDILLLPPTLENAVDYNEIPDVIVTECEFLPMPKKRKSHMHSILKKIKRPIGRVRFDEPPPTEHSSLLDADVHSYGNHNHYGIELAPLRRSDSMESFMSGLSSITTNAEEFGEELSPSRLQVFTQYNPKKWMLTIGCKQAECLITTEKQSMYWQVHMTLLPFKKHRFKTRYKSTSTPVFNQTFEVDNIAKQALTQMSVRYRVYGRTGRTGRKRLAGEAEVELGCLIHKQDNLIKEWRILKRQNLMLKSSYSHPSAPS